MVVIFEDEFDKFGMISNTLNRLGFPKEEQRHFHSWEQCLDVPEWQSLLKDAKLILLDHDLHDKIDGARIFSYIKDLDPNLENKIYGISNRTQEYLGEHYIGPFKIRQFLEKLQQELDIK